MNDIFILVLSLSLSGSLLVLALFLLKPLIRAKLSRQWQYYIWLIVIARLLLPFSPAASLTAKVFDSIGGANTSITAQSAQVDLTRASTVTLPLDDTPVTVPPAWPARQSAALTEKHPIDEAIGLFKENYWLIWLTLAVILFLRKITVYRSFVRYIKAGVQPVSDTALLDRVSEIAAEIHVNRPVELCMNPLVSSPLLLGFFRPCIVIPSADIPDKDFYNTIVHEIMHYKRWDMFYKWLVQITVCLHWFNPLVYLMGREINKACEFSCDEAVISRLGVHKAPGYGETLLESMATAGHYREALASVTLSENKNMLKERLAMIMAYKKKTALTACVSAFLSLVLVCGFAFTGAYAAKTTEAVPTPTANTVKAAEAMPIPKAKTNANAPLGSAENPKVQDMTEPDIKGTRIINLNNKNQNCLLHSSSFEASANQVLTLEVKSNISGTVDFFLLPPMPEGGTNQAQHFTFGSENSTKSIKLSKGRWAYNCTGFFDSGNISIIGTITDSAISEPVVTEQPSNQSTTNAVDAAALEVMKYSRSWDLVEYMLPYMTKPGIDAVVALNNQNGFNTQQTASNFYDLKKPTQSESDSRAYTIMQMTGNWGYASPLFTHMSNTGIDNVVALYNQKTGNHLKAADYYNSSNLDATPAER